MELGAVDEDTKHALPKTKPCIERDTVKEILKSPSEHKCTVSLLVTQ